MEVRKIVFTCIFAILTIATSANNLLEAKVIFANGKVEKGFSIFPDKPESKSIEFRYTRDGEKQSIKSEELTSVVYYNNNDSLVFERIAKVSLWNRKKITDPVWMCRVIKNYVSLYTYTDEGFSYFTGNSWSIWPSNSFYVCKKTDEPAGSIISVYSVNTINNNAPFKHYASNYFADYLELVKKIDHNEFTYKNVIEAVNFYNQWKNKK